MFDDFDDEHGQNILGNLQLETEEEPVRRGASRANSVRFDVSALQGSNWAQGGRNSGEFGPTRPGSGLGSHPMTERSLSHKSDGRHSSAGHSVHSMHSAPSGRTSSLGLDTNFMIGGQNDEDSPLDIPEPPPGLFVLGSVPSIIRCWLTTNFSHSSLLYGAVCTGSQRSILDYTLIKELGLSDQVQKSRNGCHTIKLPVYLPEAIVTQPSSRSNSPAPQLPTLTSDFEITGLNQRAGSDRKNSIRVFLGSDTLRAHNADILFSQNIMTIYGDDRNKLSVPFVRPEDETMFKNLCTVNIPPERLELKPTAASFTPIETKHKTDSASHSATGFSFNNDDSRPAPFDLIQRAVTNEDQPPFPVTSNPTTERQNPDQVTRPTRRSLTLNGHLSDTEKQTEVTSPANEASDSGSSADPLRHELSGGIWGSWRQGASTSGNESGDSTSGYQRASRGGRNMKVLKPSKPITTAAAPVRSSSSSSAARPGPAYESAPSRPSGEMRRKSQVSGSGGEGLPLRWEPKKGVTEEQKAPRAIASVPRSSNPIGGASAFAWMNPGKPKASTTAE